MYLNPRLRPQTQPGMAKQSSTPSTHLVYPTIAEDILTYRCLLGTQHRGAKSKLSHIKFRLCTEPVNEIDVQTVWEITPYPDMIDALLCNIVKFDILSTQPTGGYIHLFIETEVLQIHERGQAQLLRLYEKHKCARHFPKAAKLKGAIYRPIHRMFSSVRRASEDR